MVRKDYEIAEGKKLSLLYNRRKKHLSVLFNEVEITCVNDIHGFFGSISMCSEDVVCKIIDINVEGISKKFQVYFNRAEMYTSAELFIDGKSAENPQKTLPQSHSGSFMFHILMWFIYFIAIILMIAFIIFTMLIGLIIIIIVVVIYEIFCKVLNDKKYTFNVCKNDIP